MRTFHGAQSQLALSWSAVHRLGAGLHNMGNSCFLNAVLQCLTYTPPLVNYLLSRAHSAACAVNAVIENANPHKLSPF